jgi:hypothetical protein
MVEAANHPKGTSPPSLLTVIGVNQKTCYRSIYVVMRYLTRELETSGADSVAKHGGHPLQLANCYSKQTPRPPRL